MNIHICGYSCSIGIHMSAVVKFIKVIYLHFIFRIQVVFCQTQIHIIDHKNKNQNLIN